MTESHSSTLTFSIEDSVRLQEGQEVDEILGMTLTPEISIEQQDEQVTIQGGLRFVAEFRLQLEEESETDDGDLLSELSDFRAASDMVESEQGNVGMVEHVFPLDITIPMARIQRVDDIYVEVESFDYELPDNRCIELTADVRISGVQAQAVEPVEDTFAAEEMSEEEPEEEQELQTQFSYEAMRQPEEQLRSESDVNVETVPSKLTMSEERDHTNTMAYTKEIGDRQPESVDDSETEEVAEQTPRRDGVGSATYLTKMLRQGEEEFVKWRMCIIQNSDTLTSVAERYDLTPAQLTRFNNLASDQIEEGQILYIPVSGK